ncbi:MAG: ubiquinone/menaquinone biosynthesis methyltransferase [Actinomycetota bacterium]|nr:ubiquinone/menaquinone biosynthesis methyltransferase [Actinomycetota bacterium]
MQALPTGAEKHEWVREMFDSIAPRYDLVNRIMTFGLDSRWRSRAVTLLALRPGSVVVDLACGTADLARELDERSYRAIGVDFSLNMLRHAGLGTPPLLLADAGRLPVRSASLDGVVSGFALRNFSDLPAVAAELARVLRPGGRLSLLEVSRPRGALLRIGHSLWFRHVVPRMGAVLSDGAAYRYLPQSVAYLPSQAEMRSLLEEAGFAEVRQHFVSGGIVQIITATHPASGAARARSRPTRALRAALAP